MSKTIMARAGEAAKNKSKDDIKKKTSGPSTSAEMAMSDAMYGLAQGKLSSKAAKDVLRKNGYTADLREGQSGVIEIFPLGGGSGFKLSF